MTAILKTTDVNKQFGGLAAVTALNVDVQPGEIIGLIGPNGAGKTTSFNLITGVYKPTSGKIEFCGTNITGMKPHAITKLGVARTFQNIRLFKEMSVLENVLVAQHMRMGTNLLEATLRLPSYMKREKHIHERARALLDRELKRAEKVGQTLPAQVRDQLEHRRRVVRADAGEPGAMRVRAEENGEPGFLITPTGIPYAALEPADARGRQRGHAR